MITLKSTKEGLEFWIKDANSYSEIKKELSNTLGANRDFMPGRICLPIFWLGIYRPAKTGSYLHF